MTEPRRFGIAIAGGGIRSAALALGGLQALEEEPDGPSWTTAEKVTAVSGGAYMAGGWSLARSSRHNSAPPSGTSGEDPSAGSPSWPPHPPAPCPTAWNEGEPEDAFLISRLGYLLAKNPTGEKPAPEPEPADQGPFAQKPTPGKDVPGVIATLVLGLIFNATLLLVLLWLMVQPLAWLSKSTIIGCNGYGDNGCVTARSVWPSAIWIILAVTLLVVWVATGWVRAAFKPGTLWFRLSSWIYGRLRAPVLGVVGMATVLFVLLVAFPWLVQETPDWLAQASQWAQPAAIVGGIGGLVAVAKSFARPLSKFAPQVGGTLVVLALVLLAAHWASTATFQHWTVAVQRGYDHAGAQHSVLDRWLFQAWYLVHAGPNHTWFLCLFGWLVAYFFLNPNLWSMAPYYRGKLRGAFASYRKNGKAQGYGNGNDPADTVEPSIYELDKRTPDMTDGSPLQICGTATVSGRSVKTHYGIPGLSVTFDPRTVRLNIPVNDEGGWKAFQCSSARLERLMYRRGGSRFTTMMAVGIAGAAVAPAMGKFKIGPARVLLALANVRLGVWVPNPMYVASWNPDLPMSQDRPRAPRRVSYPQPRLGYLLKEAFGIHDPEDLYLYLTDGGHWENTGLVELVRDRNLHEIVCLDADAGKRDTETQLAGAVVLAELECGVHIDIELDPLRAAGTGRPGSNYAPRSVTVGVVRRGDHRGLLWYAKPGLTLDTPAHLLAYGENDLTYPTASTLNQFFHTAQFTAYRDLGRYNARQVTAARTALMQALRDSTTRAEFKSHAQASGTHWAVVAVNSRLKEERDAAGDSDGGERDYQLLRTQVAI